MLTVTLTQQMNGIT